MNFKRIKVVSCKPKNNYKLWLQFDDGLAGEVDLNHLVGKGVFAAWNSIDFFNQVRVDQQTDTVVWGNDLDLDPYVLYNTIAKSTQSRGVGEAQR